MEQPKKILILLFLGALITLLFHLMIQSTTGIAENIFLVVAIFLGVGFIAYLIFYLLVLRKYGG